jgi:hypothetical protein
LTTVGTKQEHLGAKVEFQHRLRGNETFGDRRIKTTWAQFSSEESEQNPAAGKKALGNKMSTIQGLLFGVEIGEADPAATSGGWQGGGYPTRMKPPCQFSHPAFTDNSPPATTVYDC